MKHYALLSLLLACSNTPEHARQLGRTAQALRPDAPGAQQSPPAYAATDEVEQHDSEGGFFRVHFTRSGAHAVPRADANGDGLPDYVAAVATEYDAVLAFYRDELGFRAPLSDEDVTDGNGGDGRFDVYLVDFPSSADGAYRSEDCLPDAPARCTGFMLQENDFNARNYPSLATATRIIASHELFHAIQHAYDAQAGVIIGEGTAVWASESYDPRLPDFESFSDGYLEHPERSLGQEPSSPVDPFAYGSGLFFRFLEERWGRALIRELWEALAADGASASDPGATSAWLVALDELLAEHDSSLAQAFAEFATWNLYTGTRADPEAGYAQGSDYAKVAEVDAALPFRDELLRMFPLSARYFTALVRDPGPYRLELIAPMDGALDGLELVLARERRSQIVEIVRVAASEESGLTLTEVGEAERIHAIVVNMRAQGESVRPALCFGALADVAACSTELGGAPPDAGVDAGAESADAGAAPREGSGGGCASAAPHARSLPPWLLATLAAGLGITFRRSRRAQRGTTA